ncbi:MAG TPA: sulfite exporter TauE/SafE family protein [Lacipirellulaceae bacterium]|nr:sulfite exporter TauE/SafE family protein [Lacipirellulaceae bacterium]
MPSLPVTPAELAIAMVLAAAGSVVQGSIGFGMAVVAAPILLLVNPVFVPGPMLLAAVFLVLLMALRDRRDVILGDVAVATVGRVLGTVPAALAVRALEPSVFELLFAVLVIAVVLLSVKGLYLRRTPRNVFAAATLSGFIGTMSSMGGPAMALVYQHETGPKIRGTLSAIFTIGTAISVLGLWWAGRFGAVELQLALLLMPAVFVGFLLSRYTAGRLDKAHTRPAVLAISALAALAIVLRVLM